MFSGCRSVCAIVGLVLLGAASPPQNPGQAIRAASERSSKADIARIALALGTLPQAERRDTGCEQGHDDRKSDLCAQWKAANAAYESAVWTQRTFWLGIVGAVIGSATLAAAGCAAWWAGSAARETAKGSQAAVDSLEETKRAFAIQLRPYLNFMGEKSDDTKFERGIGIPYGFKNFGQTPAENVEIELGWDIVPRPIGDTEIIRFSERERFGRIAPGQLVEDTLNNDIAPADIARIAKGEVMILRIRLHYIWGDDSDCCDLTWCISNDGGKPWTFRQMSRAERQRGPI